MAQGDREKRRHARHLPPEEKVLEGQGFSYMLQDISISGMAIQTDYQFETGKIVGVGWGEAVNTQVEILNCRNLLFDSTFVKNRYSAHGNFLENIQESDIQSLFNNLVSLKITLTQ